MMKALCALVQAVVEIYTALAADPSYAIAVAQAILHLLGLAAKHIKERTALGRNKLGGSFLNR
ncbi:MAG: hypothetical protein FWE98_07760 [Oscillospiraceae bacterium]|nr:hypothetical protein [Oscillospiraceae bacterium]